MRAFAARTPWARASVRKFCRAAHDSPRRRATTSPEGIPISRRVHGDAPLKRERSPGARRAYSARVRLATLLRAAEVRWSHLVLRLTAEIGEGCLFEGMVWRHGDGRLSIGRRSRFEGVPVGVELKVERGAELQIGDDVVVGSGTSIEAYDRIVVGNGCRLGRRCKLLDNHLHRLHGDRHARPPSAPLIVEDGAVVEDFALLLPGARIGRGARVGRGAVVSRAVPAGATVRPQEVHDARLR